MSTQAETIAAMTAAASRHPTRLLCDALARLDRPGMDDAERLTRAVLMDVLCARHPQAEAAFGDWASSETSAPGGAVKAITDAALAAARQGGRRA